MGNTVQDLTAGLFVKDNNLAHSCLKELLAQSEAGPGVYPFLDIFAGMLADKNSYIRIRGLLLTAANAKWDAEGKIDGMIEGYLEHIQDEKPIVARQCIQSLPEIAKHKPALVPLIRQALQNAQPERAYADSMSPLIRKDIGQALKAIIG